MIPFVPFITEKIYLELPKHDESIVISKWPEKIGGYDLDHDQMENIIDIIKSIRNVRSEKNLPDNKKIEIKILPLAEKSLFNSSKQYIQKLCIASDVEIISSELEAQNSVSLIFNDCKVFVPLESIVNSAEEKARISKEIEKTKFEIERSEKMLSNEGFVKKAPQKLIEQEKQKLEKNKALLEKLNKELKGL